MRRSTQLDTLRDLISECACQMDAHSDDEHMHADRIASFETGYEFAQDDAMHDHDGYDYDYNEEMQMVLGNLFMLAGRALTLHDMLENVEDVPEWCQEKIAVMDSMMGSVFDFLTYDHMNEAKKSKSVQKRKYKGKEYKASAAMIQAIRKGADYDELKKMAAGWATNPDAVVTAAKIVATGEPEKGPRDEETRRKIQASRPGGKSGKQKKV
jgi:hypothetical protein